MALPLEREEIQLLTEDLEVIIAAHLAWLKQISRTLICASPVNMVDLTEDAHLRTPFGQWYYSLESNPLSENSEFQALAVTQQNMHNVTRVALQEVLEKRRLEPELFDRCIDLALRLNTTLRHVQLEVIGELLSTDSLTGCASRRGMLVRLHEEQERSLRIQRPCCLCLLDFDHFKAVNDEHGHPAGDAVLRQSLRFITSVLRKYDSIYRYGGEEFLICLPGSPMKDALLVLERIRSGLEHLPISLVNSATLSITASFGLAEMHPRRPVEEAIANADMALIRAKENGRNRIEIWMPN